MRTVIFDLDGTLADTSGDLIAAANFCFREIGLGDLLHFPKDSGIALRGGRMMLRHGLKRGGCYDEAEVMRLYPQLLSAYATSIDKYTVLYPGVIEAIEKLRNNAFVVGICTNKPEALAEQLIKRLGVLDYFSSLVGADTLAVAKPDPAPLYAAIERAGGNAKRACLVGDSITDRDTARAANLPSILVTFGPSGEEMAALNPDALLPSYNDLQNIVENLVT